MSQKKLVKQLLKKLDHGFQKIINGVKEIVKK